MNMMCYQCEQTTQGTGCTSFGVCGKSPEVAALQDLLLYATKDIARYAHKARQYGALDNEVDVFVIEALFTTVTNVNFDAENIQQIIKKAVDVKAKAVALYESAASCADDLGQLSEAVAWWEDVDDIAAQIAKGEALSIQLRMDELGQDVTGLQELITYGLKGLAAYLDHAQVLGKSDADTYGDVHEILSFLCDRPTEVPDLLAKALKTGEINLKAMELLDAANTEAYGHPEPTPVKVSPVNGKCILVSGHDLKDLAELLKQTEGKGVNIYTHGEMLPAHAYPELKKYSHLVGNYGGAWQDQRKEFEAFPGAILMTTNCIQKPKDDYKARIFTCGLVQWEGVTHIADGNFTPVIEAALAADGFASDEPEKTILVGFARNAVMNAAETVINLVKEGKIKHFFLIGGCDGAKPGRNYYTEFAEKVPDDCVILTLACGKYRFNKLDFGDIDGIPRLLDVGQCNDAYSAVQIAVALSQAFDCGVNDLPLSLIISWYEQKAVAILLSLLHLGITNIKLGPSLPAFVTPAALNVLVEKFKIAPATDVEKDLAECLG